MTCFLIRASPLPGCWKEMTPEQCEKVRAEMCGHGWDSGAPRKTRDNLFTRVEFVVTGLETDGVWCGLEHCIQGRSGLC